MMQNSSLALEIEEAILKLNLQEKAICIHSSMRSFGVSSKELPQMITNCFMKNNSTIMVPTFSDNYEVRPIKKYMPMQNGAGDYSYFLNKEYENIGPFTVSSKEISTLDMGVYSQYILNQDDSLRGNHPHNSFAAIGNKASTLIGGQTWDDVYAPIKALYDMDGYILLMGVDLTAVTAIHFAEQLAGRRLFVRWAQNSNGETVGVNCGSCSEGFNHFDSVLKKCEMNVMVGKSLWRCYKAKDVIDICAKEIKQNPPITHCADSNCERCNDALLGGPYYLGETVGRKVEKEI